jgi:hypothetical protein
MSNEKKPTTEMEAAVWSSLYHDPRSSPVIVQILTGKVFDTPPPMPTDKQRQMARPVVEELLRLYYTTFATAVAEVTGEIEMPHFDIVGKADCGCVYHAEEGTPCPHDIALQKGE